MTRRLRVRTLALPPILAGFSTPQVRKQAERFFYSIADIFEAWVTRRKSKHTQRAYPEDVMSFVRFLSIAWPEDSIRLLSVSIKDVLAFRDHMLARDLAPKTLDRRNLITLQLLQIPSRGGDRAPSAHHRPESSSRPVYRRESTDAREETKALSAACARQLIALPAGETVLDYRDRAILKLYLYSGMRLATGCRLNVSDFHEDGEEATIRLHEKGDKRRTIGLHRVAAVAITEYLEKAEIRSGPLIRPRLNPRSIKLGRGRMDETTMYRVIESYPGSLTGSIEGG